MIVIVAIILLFILYLLYKKYYAIEIEVYNLNKLYGDGENAPRSMYEHKIWGTYDTIKNNKDCSRYLQCRSLFNDSHHKKYGHIIHDVVERHNLREPDTTVFRMNSTPQRILAHFDATDRYLIMVHGYKDILLFRMDNFSDEEQITFLHDVKDLKMKGLKKVLKNKSIEFDEKRIHPGDVVHLTPGLYHYIENNEINKYTILLNIDYETDTVYEKLWDKMWENGVWY